MSNAVLALLVLTGVGIGWGVLSSQREKAKVRKAQEAAFVQQQENRQTLLDSKQCSGCDLTGTDLSNAGLSGADLSGATLNSANLAGANLTGANLTGATVEDANLIGANLTDAQLDDSATLTVATVDETTTMPSGSKFVSRATLAAACTEGTAFSDAAPYSGSDSPGIAGFVREAAASPFVLQESVVETSLQASDAYGTALVLCVDKSAEPELIENCEYTVAAQDYAIERYRTVTTLTLVEAATGAVVDSSTEVSDPAECTETISITETQLAQGKEVRNGAVMGDSEIHEWVRRYVQ
ncbi:MAG: pentapeptide repeat-containing protein [Geitlerinemataceae cyanobacterium]